MLPLSGMWVPPVFVPLQTFLFGSLDFVANQLGVLYLCEEALVLAPTRGGAPSIGLEPLQSFLFGSLDFFSDQLSVLCLREEALVPVPTRGGAPSTSPRPLNDLNVETPVLHLEPMLGSNPTVSDVHIVLYSLFNTFR